MEDFDDPWFFHRLALTVTVFVLVAASHLCSTNVHIPGLWTWLMDGNRHGDQRLKNEDLLRARMLQARIDMLKKVHAIVIHFAIPYNLTTHWKFIYYPSFSSFCEMLTTVMCYLMLRFSHDLVKTERHFRFYEVLCIALHALFLLGIVSETDLEMFDMVERLCTMGTICTCMTLLDIQVTLPLFYAQAAVLTYCRLNLIGFAKITPAHAFGTVVPHLIVGGVIALCVHFIRSNIEAKLDSGEASSLMMGFRQILRGVSDGDFLLDRRSMTIVDDASCLQHVLKSNRKLTNSNFLDLFLDSESREQFGHFMEAEQFNTSNRVPRGLRVSLQGARGAVSMDLFYTQLPQLGAESNYCLLAIKEDPEQSTFPEAPLDSVPSIPSPSLPPPAPSRSSASELIAADDLVEIALLVSDVTGFLDVEEAHLSFQRKSDVSNIESGMPTLRKFIRPSDWDRVEQMFNIVINLPPAEQQKRCYFQRPTFFRVPGEWRSYLCARSTSLSLADQSVVPGRATRFWMHLTEFDSKQLASRPSRQRLQGIAEEL